MDRTRTHSTAALLAGLAFLLMPGIAFASDPTPLKYFLYIVIGVIFVPAFAATWIYTRTLDDPPARLLLRVFVVCLFWTPVQLGGAGYWWPSSFGFLDVSKILLVIESVIGSTLLLWVVCLLLARAWRAAGRANER